MLCKYSYYYKFIFDVYRINLGPSKTIFLFKTGNDMYYAMILLIKAENMHIYIYKLVLCLFFQVFTVIFQSRWLTVPTYCLIFGPFTVTYQPWYRRSPSLQVPLGLKPARREDFLDHRTTLDAGIPPGIHDFPAFSVGNPNRLTFLPLGRDHNCATIVCLDTWGSVVVVGEMLAPSLAKNCI